ncbi:MAG: hypothetical protein L3J24_09030 [Xanthomonadales bacterium]|nr:hypothetical protein [Xanthomonadales bacterium]
MKFQIENYVKITCIEDIKNRFQYKPSVDTQNARLIEVIEPYNLPEKGGKISCSIKSCHTPHYKGYLIKTSDNTETNIGKDCGKKHFPDFVVHFNKATKKHRIRSKQEQLNGIIEQKCEIYSRINDLIHQEYGGSWCQKAYKNFSKHYPNQAIDDLKQRAIRNDATISYSRKRTETEVSDMLASNPGSKREEWLYEDIPVGVLAGLDIFQQSIRSILIEKLTNPLNELTQTDKTNLSTAKLNKFARWAGDIELLFNEAEQLIKANRKFFQHDNLILLIKLDISEQAKQEINLLEWDYKNADVTEASQKKLRNLIKNNTKRGIVQL